MNWSWLLPHGKGIPVLMYHKVWPGINDDLTITPEKLREQWSYLKQEGYRAISLPEYLDIATGQKPNKGKVLLITFDDGYQNNLTYAYPLLQELGWKATFFIIAETLIVEKREIEIEQKMTLQELRSLDPTIIQLAMHGYQHEDMGKLPLEDSRQALVNTIRTFDNSGLEWHRVLAYPFGSRPGAHFHMLKAIMKDMGIMAAFRIGNKVSNVPAGDVYEIKRIDIRGTDTIFDFKVKLSKGKLKPF